MKSSDSTTTRDSIDSNRTSDLSERDSSFADSLSSTDSLKPTISYDEAKRSKAEAKELVESNPQIATFRGAKGETALHDAVARGDIHIVQAMLDKYPQLIDTPDNNGKTPLHYAAEKLQGATFKLLQDRGANVVAQDVNGIMPIGLRDQTIQTQGDGMILAAAKEGNADRVKDLLAQDPKLADAKDDKKTLLDHAVENGHPKVVEAISSFYGQQLDQANQEKYTATTSLKAEQKKLTEFTKQITELNVAAKKNIFENAENFLSKKQIIESEKKNLFDKDKTNNSAKTAYETAREETKVAKENYDRTQTELTAEQKQLDTLILQIEAANNAVVKATLNQEAVAKKLDPIIKSAGEKTQEAANRIKEATAKQEEIQDTIQLFSAVKSGALEEVQVLLNKNSALADAQDKDSKTPLHHAVENGKADVVNALIAKDPTLVMLKDNNEKNPLHYAIENGHTEIATALINLKKDTALNAPDKNGKTPLHYAAEKGDPVLFDALKKAGATLPVPVQGEKDLETILNESFATQIAKAEAAEKQRLAAEAAKAKEAEELAAKQKADALAANAPSVSDSVKKDPPSTSLPTDDAQKQASTQYKAGDYKSLKFEPGIGGKDNFENGKRPMSDETKPHIVEIQNKDGSFSYEVNNLGNPNDTKLHKVEGKFGTIVFDSTGKMVDAELNIHDREAMKSLGKDNLEKALELDQQRRQPERARASTVDLAQAPTQQQTQQQPQTNQPSVVDPNSTTQTHRHANPDKMKESLTNNAPIAAPIPTSKGQGQSQGIGK